MEVKFGSRRRNVRLGLVPMIEFLNTRLERAIDQNVIIIIRNCDLKSYNKNNL